MSLDSIISERRNKYVQYFIKERNEIFNKNAKSAGELLISINSEKIKYPYRYFRVDVISKVSDGENKIYSVVQDPPQVFDPKAFCMGEVVIEMYAFSWNSIQICFDRDIFDYVELENLITQWLDLSDEKSNGDISLAIHSVSQVESNGDLWFFTIDFGTSPADALIDFLDFLMGQGMRKIIIKSGEE